MDYRLLAPTRLAPLLFNRLYGGNRRRSGDASQLRRLGRPPRLLLVRMDQLGDNIMTTPLLRELARNFPGCRITVVCRSQAAQLFQLSPHVTDVLSPVPVGSRWIPARLRPLLAMYRLRRQLRQRHFDAALQPRWDFDFEYATLAVVLSRAPLTIGYTWDLSPIKRFANRNFDECFSLCLSPGPVRHEALRNLALVEALGGKVEDTSLDVHLSDKDRAFATGVVAGTAQEVLLALGTGANNAPAREWPPERFAELCNRLGERVPVRPVLLGTPGEQPKLDRIASLLQGHVHTPLLVVGRSVHEAIAVLERCTVFVGNDSGVAHMAAAAAIPVITIGIQAPNSNANGHNSPLRFSPWALHRRMLVPATQTLPCTENCTFAHAPHCILSVSVDEVLTAVTDILTTIDLAVPDDTTFPVAAQAGTQEAAS